MSRGYWVAGLTLILACLVGPQGHTQDDANSQQREASDEATPNGSVQAPIPIQIVESDEITKARQRSEAISQENEKNDLIAQERMADAAEAMNRATQSMMWTALLSVIFVGVGTILLIWTLCETRKMTYITSDIGQKQTRPYLVATGVQNDLQDDCYRGFLKIKNFGHSPAVTESFSFKTFQGTHPERDVAFQQIPNDKDYRVFPPSHEMKFGPISGNLAATLNLRKGQKIFVIGHIRYRNIGSKKIHITEFGYAVQVDRETAADAGASHVTVHMSSNEIPGFCAVDKDCITWELDEQKSRR